MKPLSTAFSISVLLLLFNIVGFAQLIKWNTAPRNGFVFQISNKEAQKLLTKSTPDTIFNGLLHTQVDTFDVRKGWTNRPSKGHFILATISENKLHCEYTSVFPYQVFLLKEYDALALQVLDLEGNVREDAKVKFKLRRLRIDPQTKTYRIENAWFSDENKIVTVELDGFRSIFNVEKHDVPAWDNSYYNSDDGPSFYSYMITDKNKYRPNEKIRFKSYALSQSRSPLHKELEIWLSNYGNTTMVGKIAPHRPGSYAGEFTLHDSLKLTLDRNYTLQLRERNGRVVSGCNFNYEDYELNGDKLEIHLSTKQQYYPATNELTILATDANGLILKDAKATVIVKPQAIRETFQQVVILKDTLFSAKIALDPNEPTLVNIPSTLFQKTNTVYEVQVIVVNSQNQRLEGATSATHYYSQYEITTRFSNDSIVYEILKNGLSQKEVPVKLQHNDELKPKGVMLPCKEKINPAVTMASVVGEFVSREISMSNLIPQLELQGGIEKDSFKIELRNPQKIELSWYVYQGSELLQKGSGTEWNYKSLIVDRTQTYYVELLYSFGGEERIKRKEYEFKEDYLNVSLDVPERVYPGQQIDATINVLNQLGKPVNGVDLTALAITGKLNYYLPDLPYSGNSSTPRSKKANYSKSDINKRSANLNLDYKKWERKASLDTMKYYQFTYPGSRLFKHEVSISDSTQFAPYVVQKGMAKQVYVIEINRMPVYYSWVDQPTEYSFYVLTKRKVSISLRLYDRVLLLDSIIFSEHRKTILSVDLDHLPENVKVFTIYHSTTKKDKRTKLFPSFTKTEIDRHVSYISLFKQVEGNAYLEQGRSFTPLFNLQTYSRKELIKAGPIVPGKQTFFGKNGLKTTYQHSGGYTYSFEDNIVYKLNADQLIPERLYDNSFKPMTNINDLVLTKKALFEYKYISDKWITRSVNLVNYSSHIKVLLPEEKAASGFSSIVFEDCKTKQWISPCQNQYGSKSEFSNIPRGCHNILAIYNNGTYLKIESINLKPYTKVVIDLNQNTLQNADSLSRKWIESGSKNCYGTDEPRVVAMRYRGAVYGNIKGAVYDSENMPIPGTNVVIKGTTDGTVTDVDGRFAIDSDESTVTLVISFIGYETKEVEVQVGSEVSVHLREDVKQLQEVVVTGYGVQTKSDLTYALSGRAAGVEISNPDIEKVEAKDIEKKEGEERLYKELLTLNTIRSHFNDVGFWEPKLFTDKQGQSKFRISFPDDITRWEATVYAMNRHLQTGTARKSIKSYKPIMAELNVPQFLTQGDSSFFLGRVSNYTQDKDIVGKVKWTSTQSVFENDISFSEFHVDKLPVNAVTSDSIKTSYRFTRSDGYLDGEERIVPVVEQGIVRADGTLSILKNGDQIRLKAASKESVTAEFLANPIDIYSGEAKYLLNYKYDCNEQLASKLLGLINYQLVAKYEGKAFKYDRDINKIIARLLRNQNEEFLWSWWDVSSKTSYWISSHILRALKAAVGAGYKVDLNIENITRKTEYKFDILNQYSISDADLLNALASWGAVVNYSKHVRVIDSLIAKSEKDDRARKLYHYYPNSLLKEKLLLQEVRQIAHLPFQRDTLLRYQKNGILGDVNFSDGKTASYWYDDEFTANTIAYRIVKKDSILKKLIVPMQMYFLSQRNKGAWNTYHSSNVLMSVLPDLIKDGLSKKQEAVIKLNGKVNATVDKFPYRVELLPNEELNVKKENGLPIYFMQYKKERVTKAKTGVEGFEIKTTLGNNKATLESGQPVQLMIDVNVKKEANLEYVMIEIPIPGGCSYAEKTQNNNAIETHREYFKDRTVIFCENMKSGKYSFQVQLLPRFTGKYFVNPAQVSLMYIPVVNANTDMKKVKIE